MPPLPNAAGPYVNCHQVGATASISDPAGDVALNTTDLPVPHGYQDLDIRRVTIARSDSILCLNIETASPPLPGDSYVLLLTPVQDPQDQAKISMELVSTKLRLVSTGAPLDQLVPTGGYVSVARALIGIDGDSLSLLIDHSQLASGPSFSAFRWSVDTFGGAGPGIQPYDCAPNLAPALYPPGTEAGPAESGGCIR
jgi:hypothetical protein